MAGDDVRCPAIILPNRADSGSFRTAITPLRTAAVCFSVRVIGLTVSTSTDGRGFAVHPLSPSARKNKEAAAKLLLRLCPCIIRAPKAKCQRVEGQRDRYKRRRLSLAVSCQKLGFR